MPFNCVCYRPLNIVTGRRAPLWSVTPALRKCLRQLPTTHVSKVRQLIQSSDKVREKTVQMILQQFFKDEKTKLTSEALTLITEVITVFVAEAASRTVKQAKKDGDDEITLEQFEKILPQLLLDI